MRRSTNSGPWSLKYSLRLDAAIGGAIVALERDPEAAQRVSRPPSWSPVVTSTPRSWPGRGRPSASSGNSPTRPPRALAGFVTDHRPAQPYHMTWRARCAPRTTTAGRKPTSMTTSPSSRRRVQPNTDGCDRDHQAEDQRATTDGIARPMSVLPRPPARSRPRCGRGLPAIVRADAASRTARHRRTTRGGSRPRPRSGPSALGSALLTELAARCMPCPELYATTPAPNTDHERTDAWAAHIVTAAGASTNHGTARSSQSAQRVPSGPGPRPDGSRPRRCRTA